MQIGCSRVSRTSFSSIETALTATIFERADSSNGKRFYNGWLIDRAVSICSVRTPFKDSLSVFYFNDLQIKWTFQMDCSQLGANVLF